LVLDSIKQQHPVKQILAIAAADKFGQLESQFVEKFSTKTHSFKKPVIAIKTGELTEKDNYPER